MKPERDYSAGEIDPADVAEVTPEEFVAKLFAVPMSLIDGRPWVPTEVEADADEYREGS